MILLDNPVRYFTRLNLQSWGSTFSLCEVVNASGYAAFLSMLIVKISPWSVACDEQAGCLQTKLSA
jgi:hypothetical protein